MEKVYTGVQHFNDGDVVKCVLSDFTNNYRVGECFTIEHVLFVNMFGDQQKSFLDRKGDRVAGIRGDFVLVTAGKEATLSDFM